MAEENNDPVKLTSLTTATAEDVKDALTGRPDTVKEDEPEVRQGGIDFGEFNSLRFDADDQGTSGFYNPQDSQTDLDLDQFRSEGEIFGGAVSRVKRLDQGFTYTGMEDTYNRSQEAQGSLQKMRNGLAQLVGDTAINVAQGWVMFGGAASALYNGDFTNLYDNAVSNRLDQSQEHWDKYFDISRGGNQSGLQKATNFFADDLLGGVSFILGAVGTELTMSAVTAASLGAAAPAQAAASTGIVARGARLLKKAVTGGKRVIKGQLIDDTVKGAAALGDDATRAAASAGIDTAARAGVAAEGYNAAGRVARQLLTGAGMESGMEARHMLNEAVENQKANYEAVNGKNSFTEEMANEFREEISGYADGVFALNLALVGGSNMMMFPKLFGVGLRKGMRTSRFINTAEMSAKARGRLAKRLGVDADKLPEIIDAARGTRLGRLGRAINPNTGAIGRALYEGVVEEGGQGTISRAYKTYIDHKYDPSNQKQTLGYLESFLEGVEGSYGSAEGLKEVAIGMILGGLGVPNVFLQRNAEGKRTFMMGGLSDMRAQNRIKDQQLDRLIELSKQNGDVAGILKAEMEGMIVQNGLQKELDDAVAAGDFAKAKDLESKAVFSHGVSKILTGRYEDALEEAAEILDQMTVEELREALGPEAKNMTNAEVRNHRTQVLQQYTARMERVRDSFDHMQELYTGNNHDVQVNIAELVYDIADRDAREKAVAEKLIKHITEYGADEVIGATRLQAELELTVEQINGLRKSTQKIRAIEKQLRTKQERKIIKNIDSAKQAAREQEISRLEQELQEAQEGRKKILKSITVKNRFADKYDFDTDEVTERVDVLLGLYEAIEAQGDSTLPGEAKQVLQEGLADMVIMAGDRAEMIEIYNDLIKPGGYQRFIEAMEKRFNALYASDITAMHERVTNDDPEDAETETSETPAQQPPQQQGAQNQGSEVAAQDSQAPAGEAASQDDGGPLSDLSGQSQSTTAPAAEESGEAADETPAEQQGEAAEEAPAEQQGEAGKTASNQLDLFEQEDNNDDDDDGGDGGTPSVKPVGGQDHQVTLYPDTNPTDGSLPKSRPLFQNGLSAMANTENLVGKQVQLEYNPNDGSLRYTYEGKLIMEFTNAADRAFANEQFARLPEELRNKLQDTGQAVLEVVDVPTRINGYRVPQTNRPRVSDIVKKEDVDAIMYFRPENESGGSLTSVTVSGERNVDITQQFASMKSGQTMLVINGVGYRTMGRPLSMEVAEAIYDMRNVAWALAQGQNKVEGMPDSQFNDLKQLMERAYGMDFSLSEQQLRFDFQDKILKRYTRKSKNSMREDLSDDKATGVRLQVMPGMGLVVVDYTDRDADGKPTKKKLTSKYKNEFLVALSKARFTLHADHFEDGAPIVRKRNGKYEVDSLSGGQHALQNFEFTERFPARMNDEVVTNIPTSVRLRFNEQGQQPITGPQGQEVDPPQDLSPEDLIAIQTAIDQATGGIGPQGFGVTAGELGIEEPSEFEKEEARRRAAREKYLDTKALERAGALYLVPGLSVKDTRDAVNVMTGEMAGIIAQHMKTTDRKKTIKGGQIKTKLGDMFARRRNAIAQVPGTEKLVKVYDTVLKEENFDKLIKLSLMEMMRIQKGVVNVSETLLSQGLDELVGKTMQTIAEDTDGTAETQDENAEKGMKSFDDNFAFGINPASTLRLELKMAMMTVRHSATYQNADTVGSFGLKFMDFNTLSGNLNMILAGKEATWETMSAALEKVEGKYPYVRAVLDLLNPKLIKKDAKDPRGVPLYPTEDAFINARDVVLQMRQQFIVYAAKDQANFIGVKAYLGKKKRLFQTNSNDRDMQEFALADFRAQLIQKNFYTKDDAGNYVINKERFDELLKKMDAIVEEVEESKRPMAMTRLLAIELGIEMDAAFLAGNVELNSTTAATTLFGQMRRHLREMPNQAATTNVLDGPSNPVKKFLEVTVGYRQNLVQNTSKDGNNNLRWQYVASKHLSDQLRRELESTEDTNNPLINAMRNEAIRSAVRIDYLDHINKARSTRRGRDFHAMEINDRLLSRLTLYGNENTTKNGRHLVRMFMPTLSDKGTMPVIQMPSMKINMAIKAENASKRIDELSLSDFVGNVARVFDESMGAAIQAEVVRIKRIKINREEEAAGIPWEERSNQKMENDPLDDKQLQADFFVLMPALNGIAKRYMEGELTEAEFQAEVDREAPIQFEAAVTNDIREILGRLDGDIFDRDDTGKIVGAKFFLPTKDNYKYVSNLNGIAPEDLKTPEERFAAIMAFVAKFAVEGIRTNTNMTTAMLGDPGAFFKKDAATTAVNMGKRFAGLIAPGSVIPRVAWKNPTTNKERSNNRIRSFVIPERASRAKHIEYLKKLNLSKPELEAYEDYDSADAAEYTTVEEHLSILYAQGKLRRREFLGLLKKAQDPNAKFTNVELAWFQPMKPVAVGKQGGRMLYVKSASFPLVPALTKGTELDKLRVFMETHDIQRAAHTSAIKTGQIVHDIRNQKRSIYNADGTLDLSDTKERFGISLDDKGNVVVEPNAQVIEYPREFMRIQQEVPAGRGATKIHGSQAAKLILVDLAKPNYKFELDGEEIDGKALHREYLVARRREAYARVEIFAQKYGLEYRHVFRHGVRTIRFAQTPEYKKRMAAAIRQEAVERNYDLNELADLHLNEDDNFAIPLTMGSSRSRVEQLLMSIIRKEMYESRVQGYSGPIRPEPGIKLLRDFDQNAITWVVDKDGKRLYNGSKLETQQGKKPDQIIMPWKFKQAIDPYLDKDTNTISLERIPREILQTFAYRIPGQGKNSSATFEIVGFLPKEYGDTLIVPEELVARIGQDYDIDKMFGMLYELEEYGPEDKPNLRIIRQEDNKLEGTINVYYGQKESETSTRVLSNLAERRFTYQGREYGSVEHAYQSNKSGTFDQATYDKYEAIGGFGKKIRGPKISGEFDNLELMRVLVVESFMQNPESEAAEKLLEYEKFTHNTKQTIDEAFLEGLYAAQDALLMRNSKRRASVARNRALDVYNAAMRTEDENVQRAIHRPVGDGYAVELAEHVERSAMSLGSPMSIMYNEMKADAARSSKSAIGVLADVNVMHAQIQQANLPRPMRAGETFPDGTVKYVYIPITDSQKDEEGNYELVIDRKTQATYGKTEVLDKGFKLEYKNQPEAGTISNQFSRLLNHAVDNENNQMLSRLGITGSSYFIWTAMTHMGYNQETITMLVNTPVVQEFLKRTDDIRSIINEDFIDSRSIMLDMIDARKVKPLKDENGNEIKRTLDISDEIDKGNIPKDALRKLFQGDTEGMSEEEIAALETNILFSLLSLEKMMVPMQKMQNFMRLDTKTPKTRAELEIRRRKARNFMRTKLGLAEGDPEFLQRLSVSGVVSELDMLFGRTVLDIKDESIYVTPLVETVLGMFAEDSYEDFTKADTYVKGIIQYLSAEHAVAVENAWLLTEAAGTPDDTNVEAAYPGTAAGLRNRLLGQEAGAPSLAQQIIDTRAAFPALNNNLFLRHLILEPNPRQGYARVEFNGDRTINASPLELQQAFLELANSNEPQIRALAKDLYVYYLVTKGAVSSRGFGKYIPSEYKQYWKVRDTLNPRNAALYADEKLNKTAIHDNIVRHNPSLAPHIGDMIQLENSEITWPDGRKSTVTYVHAANLGIYPGIGYFRAKGNVLYRIDYTLTHPGVLEGVEDAEIHVITQVSTLGDYLSDEYDVVRHPANYKGLDLKAQRTPTTQERMESLIKVAQKINLAPKTVEEIHAGRQTRIELNSKLANAIYNIGGKGYRLTMVSSENGVYTYDLTSLDQEQKAEQRQPVEAPATVKNEENQNPDGNAGTETDHDNEVNGGVDPEAKRRKLAELEAKLAELEAKQNSGGATETKTAEEKKEEQAAQEESNDTGRKEPTSTGAEQMVAEAIQNADYAAALTIVQQARINGYGTAMSEQQLYAVMGMVNTVLNNTKADKTDRNNLALALIQIMEANGPLGKQLGVAARMRGGFKADAQAPTATAPATPNTPAPAATQPRIRDLVVGEYRLADVREHILNSLGPNVLQFGGMLEQILDIWEKNSAGGRVPTIKVIMDRNQGMGEYDSQTNTLTINRKGTGAKDALTGTLMLPRVVTHELIHAVTATAINLSRQGAPFRKMLPPGVVEKLDELQRLRDMIAEDPKLLEVMGLSIEDRRKWKRGMALLAKTRNGLKPRSSYSAAEQELADWTVENREKYYGLVGSDPENVHHGRTQALHEFVAEVMSNPEFAERLSRVKITPKQNMLERIVAKIAEILESMGITEITNARDYAQGLVLSVIQENAGVKLTSQPIDLSAQNDVGTQSFGPGVLGDDTMAELAAEDLEQMVAYKRKRIREFTELRARFIDNQAFVKTINQRIAQEEADLDRLKNVDDSVKLSEVVAMADRELSDIEDAMKRIKTSGRSVEVHQAVLQNLYSAIQYYDQIRGIIEKSPKAREALREVAARAAVLREDYLWNAREMLRTYARERFKGTKAAEFVDSEAFYKMKDLGFLSSRFMDASRQGRIELDYIDSIIREAAAKQQAEFTARLNRYRGYSEAFKKTKFFKKYGWAGLFEQDEKGKPMNQLVGPISYRWRVAYDSARKNFLQKGKSPEAMDNWLKENTDTINLETKFEVDGLTVKRKNNVAYDRMMEQKYGKEAYQEMLASQERRLEDYLLARQAYLDVLEGTETDDNYRKQLLETWESRNDPFRWQKWLEKGGTRPAQGTGAYVELVPVRTKNGKPTGYYNERYDELKKEEAAMAFYNDYRAQMQEMMRRLPLHEMRDRHLMEAGLFIPAIQRKLTEDWAKGGITGLLAKAHAGVLTALTVTDEDMKTYLIDPVTGNKREQLPVYFLNPLKPGQEQDFDLDRVFAGFTMMATTYAAKNEIEDLVKMTDSVMGDIELVHTDSTGRKLLGKLGLTLASRDKKNASNVQTMMQTLMDQYYGRPRKKVVGAKVRRLMTKAQRAEYDELDAKIREMPTDDPDRDLLIQKRDALVPNIEAGKVIYNIQQFIQAKGMGWNIPAATTNWIFGTLSVAKHARGQADFNEDHYRKAMAVMSNSTMNAMSLNYAIESLPTAQKIQNMMVRMDVLKDFTEIRFDQSEVVKRATQSGSQAVNRKGLNKLRMYEIQRSSEYFVYGISTVAMLMAEEVNGKSLWSQMNQDGIIDVDGYRPGEEKLTALMAKVDQVNKRIHGNYDPNSPIAIKKTLAGGLLMQFRSWLPEAIATRVEEEKYDIYLGREVKGTYRTMFGQDAGKHMMNMLKLALPIRALQGKLDESISQVDQENIRKFAAHMRQYIGLYLVMMMLKALRDDDEEDKYALNYALNIASRIENDLSTFGKPGSAYKLVKDPFAAVGLMNDIGMFFDATAKTIAGDPIIPTGRHAGKSRMAYHGGKLLPPLNAGQRQMNNLEFFLDN